MNIPTHISLEVGHCKVEESYIFLKMVHQVSLNCFCKTMIWYVIRCRIFVKNQNYITRNTNNEFGGIVISTVFSMIPAIMSLNWLLSIAQWNVLNLLLMHTSFSARLDNFTMVGNRIEISKFCSWNKWRLFSFMTKTYNLQPTPDISLSLLPGRSKLDLKLLFLFWPTWKSQ